MDETAREPVLVRPCLAGRRLPRRVQSGGGKVFGHPQNHLIEPERTSVANFCKTQAAALQWDTGTNNGSTIDFGRLSSRVHTTTGTNQTRRAA
jgi:hypothetical protein